MPRVGRVVLAQFDGPASLIRALVMTLTRGSMRGGREDEVFRGFIGVLDRMAGILLLLLGRSNILRLV